MNQKISDLEKVLSYKIEQDVKHLQDLQGSLEVEHKMLSNDTWRVVAEFSVSENGTLPCERFMKHKRCNHAIKHVYVVENTNEHNLYNIGSNCMYRLLHGKEELTVEEQKKMGKKQKELIKQQQNIVSLKEKIDNYRKDIFSKFEELKTYFKRYEVEVDKQILYEQVLKGNLIELSEAMTILRALFGEFQIMEKQKLLEKEAYRKEQEELQKNLELLEQENEKFRIQKEKKKETKELYDCLKNLVDKLPNSSDKGHLGMFLFKVPKSDYNPKYIEQLKSKLNSIQNNN